MGESGVHWHRPACPTLAPGGRARALGGQHPSQPVHPPVRDLQDRSFVDEQLHPLLQDGMLREVLREVPCKARVEPKRHSDNGRESLASWSMLAVRLSQEISPAEAAKKENAFLGIGLTAEFDAHLLSLDR